MESLAVRYQLRKRKAPALEPPPGKAAPGPKQPRGLATRAASEPPLTPATPAEDDLAQPLAEQPTPSKPPRERQWEDVGLKVDTSKLLLGMGSPTADAALVCGPAATAVLANGGFTQELLQTACQHLATADAKLVPYIEQYGPPERLLAKSGASCFASLAKSIAFQQLATSAAAAIFGRVLQVCQCEEQLTPEAVLGTSVEELRGCGLSERKVSYMRDLADKWHGGTLSDQLLLGWDDAQLRAELTKVKGIGTWSVDMFAMFHLGHPDVLPVGDLGVRRGMQALYKLKDLPDTAEMEAIAAPWRPFRSAGAYYMWRVEAPRAGSKKAGKAKPKPKADGGGSSKKRTKAPPPSDRAPM